MRKLLKKLIKQAEKKIVRLLNKNADTIISTLACSGLVALTAIVCLLVKYW